MVINLNIFRSIFNYSVGNAFYSFFLWINIIILAKLGTSEDIGYYTYAMAMLSPLYAFLGMNLRSVYVTDSRERYSFEEYYTVRFILGGIALAGSSIVFFFLFSEVQCVISIGISVLKFFESQSDIMYGYNQKLENSVRICFSQVLRSLTGTFLFAISYFFTNNVAVSVFFLAFSWGIIYFFYDRKPKFRIKYEFSISSIYSIIKTSYPLGILLLINQLSISMPRLYVGHYLGAEELGYYSAITYFMFVLSVFINALGQTFLGYFSKYFVFDIYSFIKLLFLVLACVFFAGVSVFFLGYFFHDIIISVFYGPEYAEYKELFCYTLFASVLLFMSTMLGTALTSTRMFGGQLLLNIPVVLTMFLFYFFSEKNFSFISAIVGFIIGMFVKFFVQSIYLFFLIKRRLDKNKCLNNFE